MPQNREEKIVIDLRLERTHIPKQLVSIRTIYRSFLHVLVFVHSLSLHAVVVAAVAAVVEVFENRTDLQTLVVDVAEETVAVAAAVNQIQAFVDHLFVF